MNITAVTIGSTGDVQPFLALGALNARGHHLKIATFPRFQPLVEKHGFAFAPVHGDEDLMMKRLIGDGVTGMTYLKGLSVLLNQNKAEILADVLDACRSQDLILYTVLGSLAYHAAESLRIPCMRAMFCPLDSTGDAPIPGMPALPLGRWYNRLSYLLSDAGFSLFTKKELNEWRVGLGLEKWNGHSYHAMFGKPVETLYAYSQFLAPKPAGWGEHLHITGFWPLREETYVPADEGLMRFLEGGDKPIYIGFGSMVGGSFEEMRRIILESLKNTGQRAILASGWRKFGADHLPPNVYCVDFVPHDWLFSRVKAVVHHGGAGTTAAGLRAGEPTLVIFFGGDQPFWGGRVYSSGAGSRPIPRRKLTVALMTERLRQLEEEPMRRNAERLAGQFAEEDGCRRACDIIERYSAKL
jgi:sterol 3beta-glucosyltransferase